MKTILLLLCLIIFSKINAQAINSTAHKPGSGNALKFDGINSYVDIGASFNYQVFSIDMWVKPKEQQQIWADIFDNNHNDNSNFVCQQKLDTLNYYVFGCQRKSGHVLGVFFYLKPNVWQHLALVKSNSAISVYINGVLIESNPWSGTINYQFPHLRLSRWGGGGRNWNGSVDELRAWNIALTQKQIRERMCRKIKASDTLFKNLLLYYNFDESTGTTAFDGSATANNATLIAGPAHITSGARIGDTSAYDYNANAFSLANPDNSTVRVHSISGNPDGIQLYRIDDTPNSLSGLEGVKSNNSYFGIFSFGDSANKYRLTYTYPAGAVTQNEDALKLYKRWGNADITWQDALAVLNTTNNTLEDRSRTTEFIVGTAQTNINAVLNNSGYPTSETASAVTLTLWPNPSNGVLYLQTKNFPAMPCYLQLTNMAGKTVFTQTATTNSTINIGKLPKGMYVVQVSLLKNQQHLLTKQLLIQ